MQTEQPTHNHLARALQLLGEDNSETLANFLEELHPTELVQLINSVETEQKVSLLSHITGLDTLSNFIAYADDQLRAETLALLDETRIAAVVRRQEIDDAADTIGILPRPKQLAVLKRLNPKFAKDLKILLQYHKETAGGIMTTLFLALPSNFHVEQAIGHIRSQLQEETLDADVDMSSVYIVDLTQRLVGVLSIQELLAADTQARLEEIMITDVISVSPDADQEKVAQITRDYDFRSIPVVSPEDQRLLGIVTVDDIIHVIQEEHTEDLLKLAGTEEQDTVRASVRTSFTSRLPWLMASFAGGVLGATILGRHVSELEQVVALAFFMPVVFGMGGNVGSQSATITVHGIATGQLREWNAISRVRREFLVGASLGITFGILLGIASYALFQEPRLSIIVASSILATMSVASVIGSMLPLLLKRIGVDPAVASGPFVTTGMDIVSISIYFSIATLLLS